MSPQEGVVVTRLDYYQWDAADGPWRVASIETDGPGAEWRLWLLPDDRIGASHRILDLAQDGRYVTNATEEDDARRLLQAAAGVVLVAIKQHAAVRDDLAAAVRRAIEGSLT